MKEHQFYSERRKGRGPKFIKTQMNRMFAISSTKMIEQLKAEKEAKPTGMKKVIGQKRKAST